ncbi:MAG TPA: adenylate/guanylate cyclase domain-containing protein [Motilibacteraceae bacterium]|nr:adenylate/guanylate cyclase domain-containing protein [Motilibacteraceae bacterium]
MLFADLVGFTPLSAARDPEEVRELLSRYFEVARSVIERHGGAVEKFIGDAVMAVWGTPVASEQDPERAVRAALELVDAVAALGVQVGVTRLAARAGVVTGEVAVTVGAVLEGMVAGDPVNTAARVQTAAEPGVVLVDEATRRLAAAVAFTDAGEHELKGKAEPERLWRATRVVAGAGGLQRGEGLEGPLTGRDPELRLVKELFHACVDRRAPRLVVVTGPAGVGKSRVGWEFEKYVDGLAGTVWWHRGRCLSYGDGVAYWALAQAVRQRLGIAEEDPVHVAGTKLAEGLARLVPDAAERDFVTVRLARLLGLALPDVTGATAPVLGREELFAGWRIFFERLAATAPVVWVVEDAQHADPALLEFLDHLVDWIRGLPVFVLVLGRQGLTETRPGFGIGRNRTALALDPLDPESMDALVTALVPGLSVEARRRLVAHAEGLPLFAVETVRSLVDRELVRRVGGEYRLVADVSDLHELSVPESLRGLLAARLDSLPPQARAVLDDAAVLGTTFPVAALMAVCGRPEAVVRPAVAELVRREVLEVCTDPLSPRRGDYQFTQELLRQVAYETLSRRDRKARHLAVARHLRTAFPDDGEEVADAVARHYRDALAAVPDDPDVGELREIAVAMTARAARQAERTAAPAAAAAAYRTAADLMLAGQGLEESVPADAAGGPGPSSREGISTSDERERVLRLAADWVERASLQARVAGRRDQAVELARWAGVLHGRVGDERGLGRARQLLGFALLGLGRLAEARAELEAAVAVLSEDPDQDTVHAMEQLASCLVSAGEPEAAARLALRALDLADAVEADDVAFAGVLLILALARSGTNRRLSAALFEQAAAVAGRAGSWWIQARATGNLGDLQAGFDWDAAERATRAGIELVAAAGDMPNLVTGRCNLAGVLLVRGDWAGARELLQDTAVYADGMLEVVYLASEQALLAGLCGDVERAAAALRGIEPHRPAEAVEDRACIALAEAAAAWGAGDLAGTVTAAREALSHSRTLGLRFDVVRWAWPLASRSARLLGDDDVVVELLTLVDGHPRGQVPPLLRAEADVARAHLARRGDAASQEDVVLLDRAVETLRDARAPYFLAGALLDRGRDGDLAEAREIVDRLGARPLAELIPTAPRRSA